MYDEGEQFEKEEVDMQDVNKQGLPSTNLQLYLAFSQKLFTIAKQAFLAKKKGKEDMVFIDVWISSQMEDKKNQLVIGQNKLDSLLLAL